MTTPVLYDYWRSSASYRVRIALNLKDIAYQAVSIDLQTQQHGGAEHRARNPQGFVPALDIDGSMMTQSLAIIEYLDCRDPAPALLPNDPAEAARLRAIAYAIAMEIHPICNPSVVAHYAAAFDGSDDDRKIWMQHFIDKGLRAVEVLANHPASGRFLHGDSPGLADIVLVPQLYNARRWDVPLDDMLRLTAIDAACRDLPAFAAAAPEAVNSAPS